MEGSPGRATGSTAATPAKRGKDESASVLPSFLCALTGRVMTDPVSTRDGFIFERAVILEWFSMGTRSNPLTGKLLPSPDLRPEMGLRRAIAEWQALVQAGLICGADCRTPRGGKVAGVEPESAKQGELADRSVAKVGPKRSARELSASRRLEEESAITDELLLALEGMEAQLEAASLQASQESAVADELRLALDGMEAQLETASLQASQESASAAAAQAELQASGTQLRAALALAAEGKADAERLRASCAEWEQRQEAAHVLTQEETAAAEQLRVALAAANRRAEDAEALMKESRRADDELGRLRSCLQDAEAQVGEEGAQLAAVQHALLMAEQRCGSAEVRAGEELEEALARERAATERADAASAEILGLKEAAALADTEAQRAQVQATLASQEAAQAASDRAARAMERTEAVVLHTEALAAKAESSVAAAAKVAEQERARAERMEALLRALSAAASGSTTPSARGRRSMDERFTPGPLNKAAIAGYGEGVTSSHALLKLCECSETTVGSLLTVTTEQSLVSL